MKRLEKKVKKLELENFESEIKNTEIEASKNEIIKKLSLRIKIIESDPNYVASKVFTFYIFFFFFEFYKN